jgi:[acyl-carrier-protein] S-malonyltransferase
VIGSAAVMEKAVELARVKGAVKAIPLQVSGAFHSPLMQPAVEGLAAAMAKLDFKNPAIPVIANTSALPLTDIQAIKDELLRQLCNSVQWQPSVEYMIQNGTTVFVEIGAGNVLTGLVRRIDKNVRTINIGTLAELGNIIIQ